MTLYKTAYNTSDQAIVVDDLGHVLGGGDWGAVDVTCASVKAAIDADLLLLVNVDKLPEGSLVRGEVWDAMASADARNERLEAARSADKADLQTALFEQAPDEIASLSEKPTKAELAEAVAGTDIDVPDAPKSSGKSRASRRD